MPSLPSSGAEEDRDRGSIKGMMMKKAVQCGVVYARTDHWA